MNTRTGRRACPNLHRGKVARSVALTAFFAAFSWAVGCTESSLIGSDGTAGTSATGGSAGDGGTPGSGGMAGGDAGSSGSGATGGSGGECMPRACLGRVYACGDCLDNDADGAADAADVDCLGSCDDTEDALNGGLTGEGGSCRQDCYFDRDIGSGNDDCYWSPACDTLEPRGAECPYDPQKKIPGAPGSCEELAVEQSAGCLDLCLPLTPNGCDCFGCCELPAGSGVFKYVGVELEGVGACTIGTLDDPMLCPPCTPVPSCLNSCERCELCVAKTTLPADCDGGTTDQCPTGVTPCGLPGQASCPSDQYCLTGCCFDIIE